MTEVVIHLPCQFEALRMCNNIRLERFIRSMHSMTKVDTSGGKSESSFLKSEDELYLVKRFTEAKEVTMFQKFAVEYFKHMRRLAYENKPSLLGKIYGLFEVKDKGGVAFYLVMEYLFLGMPQDVTIYDLKGSETNRWVKGKKGVLLDTNFRIDRNAEPIPIEKEHYRFIDRAFQVRGLCLDC